VGAFFDRCEAGAAKEDQREPFVSFGGQLGHQVRPREALVILGAINFLKILRNI